MTDTVPGTAPKPDPLTPPLPDMPAHPDSRPAGSSRPTTRAGRQAARAAREAKAAGGKPAKADKAPTGAKAAPRRATLETRLAQNFVTIGTMVAAAGAMTSPAVQLDGVAIIEHAPNLAAALDRVAKDDPRVAASLERMLTAGVWSGLIAATLPLVVTMAGNHGALPPHIVAMLAPGSTTPPAPEGGPVAPPGGVGLA
jgi:hypothetical protein